MDPLNLNLKVQIIVKVTNIQNHKKRSAYLTSGL
jgi:hypothetical protein